MNPVNAYNTSPVILEVVVFIILILSASDQISLTSDKKYPTLGGDFQLTCTLDMGEEGWQVQLHRVTGVGIGAECGTMYLPIIYRRDRVLY